jgi:hypothetical protein
VGVERWLAEQEALWRCSHCSGSVCVIDKHCYDCGAKIS